MTDGKPTPDTVKYIVHDMSHHQTRPLDIPPDRQSPYPPDVALQRLPVAPVEPGVLRRDIAGEERVGERVRVMGHVRGRAHVAAIVA